MSGYVVAERGAGEGGFRYRHSSWPMKRVEEALELVLHYAR